MKGEAPRTLKVITYNAKVGRRPKVVATAVQKMANGRRPHVILLQEAHGYIRALRKVRGYKLIVPNGRGEARGNPILVRCDLPARRRKAIRCVTPWRGPKAGKKHRGRVFTVVDLGGRWRVVNVHRTRPGWSPGGKAFREEHDKLLALAHATPGHMAFVVAGDQNIGTRTGRDRADHTPWALAKATGARIATPGYGLIDYAIARGATAKKVKRLPKHGSDHRALLVTLRKD